MNLSAIFSKTGKGVQEASGKTSQLSRADRSVLSAIDGKTSLTEVQKKFEKLDKPKFEALIQQLDKDGFIREVSSGSQSAAPTTARPAAAAAKAAPPPPKPASSDDGDGLDFTQAIKIPSKAPAPAAPKPPQIDLAAAARAGVERKKEEDGTLDYRSRQELQAKMKAEADAKAKADAEAKAKADAETKAKLEARARVEAEVRARAAANAKAASEAKAAADAKSRAEAEEKARAEAEAKVKAEAEAKVKAELEAKARADLEAKGRAEADAKMQADAEAKVKAAHEAAERSAAEAKAKTDAADRDRQAAEDRARKEMEEKARRDEEIMRQRLEAEMKAQLENERKARAEEDRKREEEAKKREEEAKKRREEEDRRRKEEDERRAKEDAERRAKEEAERKKREDEERKRAHDEGQRKELEATAKRDAEALRQKLEAEMKAKLEAERKAREEEDLRKRKETDERRSREYVERRAQEEAERKARDDAEAKARADAAASLPKIAATLPPAQAPKAAAAPAASAASAALGDDLLADLDSFGKREEEEQREKEEAERKAKEEAERKAKAEAESRAKEEADRKRREEEERARKDEEEKRAKEEAERKEREEEERRKEEEAERKRKAKEALAAKQAEEKAARAGAGAKPGKKSGAKAAADDDIGVSDDDLDTDDLKRDQKVAAEMARKVAREQPAVAVSGGRPKKWGKPVAIALFVLLVAGLGALHVMPLSTAEYEKAASEAMGLPVKISSARLSMITGLEVKLEGVSIGDAVKIRVVHGSPEVGSLLGSRKAFSRMDLEGVSISQSQVADALLGKVAGENFRVARITIKQLVLDGPLKLPALDIDAAVSGDGSLQSVKLTGADKLVVQLLPKGGDIAFEISAGSLALPFVPALILSEFSMKGSANRAGVTTAEFDGRAYDGVISGSARIRWGATWTVEGELRARGVKVAVFAPALVSDGKVEGRGAYTMTGTKPATLYESARLQGEFKIEKGVLGSFDLSRALQSGGANSSGTTIFNELTGQGVYDKGTVQITSASVTAGAMNAGMGLNIDANGALSGRVVADVKTANQNVRATLNISGKVQDPVIRK